MNHLESYERKMSVIPKLVHGMIAGSMNGVVISGSPGIGKSHTVDETLDSYGDKINVTRVKGHITPFSLFNTLMSNPSNNDIIVLDDADSAFEEVGALNILKAATDTKRVRTVTWLSTANLGEQSFQFEGKVIILTNVNMRLKGSHYRALMDRFNVYDPRITLDEKLHKIKDLAQNIEDISQEVGKEVIEYLFHNDSRIDNLSIRTFVKTSQLADSMGEGWQDIADMIVLDS